MNEKEIYAQFEKEIIELADKYSILRLKVVTTNFDRDYRRGVDGNFLLVSVKAIVRVLGKTSKVAIGEGTDYADYEAAHKAIRAKWSGYYKKVRASRTPEELAREAARQRRYREARKQRVTELKRQQ